MKNLPRRKSLLLMLSIAGLCVFTGSIVFSIYRLKTAPRFGNELILKKLTIVRDFKIVNALTIISALMLACMFCAYACLITAKPKKLELETFGTMLAVLVTIVPATLYFQIYWFSNKDLEIKVVNRFYGDLHLCNITLMALAILLFSFSACCLISRNAHEFGDLPLPPTPSLIMRDPYDIIMEYYSNKKEEMSI